MDRIRARQQRRHSGIEERCTAGPGVIAEPSPCPDPLDPSSTNACESGRRHAVDAAILMYGDVSSINSSLPPAAALS